MALLFPYPVFRALDANGDPLAGGKLYAFDAGTSTPRATYTDQGAGTPNAHPIILDANGEANVWLDGAYKLRLDDADDVVQWTVDNVEQFISAVSNTLSPSANADSFQFTTAGTINEAASGTHTLLGGAKFDPPTIVAGAATVTEAVTLYISAAPSASGAVAYALHVDAGATQLDGALVVAGASTLTTVTSGDISVAGSDATVTLRDTDGVWGTAIPKVEFQDSASAVGGSVAFTTGSDLALTNGLSTGDITLTTNGGEVIIMDQLIIRDDGATWGTAHPLLTFEDSASAEGAEVGFVSGEGVDDFGVINARSGANLILNTNGGVVQTDSDLRCVKSTPRFVVKDIIGTWGTANPRMTFEDSAGTEGGSLAFTTGSEMLLTNSLSGGAVQFATNAGIVQSDTNIRITKSDPRFTLRDSDGTWGTAIPEFTFEDSATTEGGSIGFNASSAMVVTNALTNGAMIFTTTGTGNYVFTNLPTSDPSVAGAMWSNSGVATISAG